MWQDELSCGFLKFKFSEEFEPSVPKVAPPGLRSLALGAGTPLPLPFVLLSLLSAAALEESPRISIWALCWLGSGALDGFAGCLLRVALLIGC